MIWTSHFFHFKGDDRKRDILYGGSTIPFIRVSTAVAPQENSNILGEHGSEAGSPQFHAVDVATFCLLFWLMFR